MTNTPQSTLRMAVGDGRRVLPMTGFSSRLAPPKDPATSSGNSKKEECSWPRSAKSSSGCLSAGRKKEKSSKKIMGHSSSCLCGGNLGWKERGMCRRYRLYDHAWLPTAMPLHQVSLLHTSPPLLHTKHS